MNRYPKDTQLVELARESGSLQATATQVGVSRVSLTNYLLRRPQLDAAVRAVLNSAARVDLADDHKSSIHPDPPNRPGKNWIEKIGGHLPSFIKRVAKHIMSDSGYTQSRAIAAAISQCKKGRLGPKGLAAAAQWEALKARAHAHSNTAYRACQVIELGHEVVDHFRVIELATLTAQQQAEYYGTARTGTKAKAKPASTSGGKKKVVRTEAGARRYKVPIGSEIGAARDKNAAAAQQNAAARGNYEKAVGAKDRDAQVAALNPKDLGDLSRIAFSFRSSDPNVVALRMTAVRELTKRGMDPKQFGYLGGGSAKPTAKVVAKAPARKPTVKKPAPAAKKPIPKDPKAVGPHKSSPGQVRVR